MKIINTEDEIRNYVEQNVARYYKSKSLFPFLGAGFTKGCKARRNPIPDGKKCSSMMKELIIEQDNEIKNEINLLTDFDKIANYFYRLVPKDKIQGFINDNFTGVQLDKRRSDFVNFEWPFIYTLNIDDGIERSSRFAPILPNRRINRNYLNKSVFKLHGDAVDEVTYIKDTEGIIFSRRQYLQSLTENKDLLNIFLEDYSTYNFILIGCSLENELDLEYILANNKGSAPARTDKIYVTSDLPNKLKQLTLADYGINICLIVNDYNNFYDLLIETLSTTVFDESNIFAKYLVKEFDFNQTLQFNQRIICGEEEVFVRDNKVTLPSFFTHRTLTDTLIGLLKSENILFVVGKRVSGKSFLIYDLIRSLMNEQVYLIPSKVSLDSNLVDNILELNNSIVIFDTDTISAYDIEDIYYKISLFKQNNIRFIFMVNSSDRLMVSVPYFKVIDSRIEELDNMFKGRELSNVNFALSKLGIVNFKGNWNILSNIVNHKIIYRKITNEVNIITTELDERALKIFILNAIFDKIYSSLYRALKIDYDIVRHTVDNSNNSLEFEYDLSEIERGQHSNYKVVTNSKSFLFALLGSYIFKNKGNFTNAANAIVSVISKLREYESFKNYWKNLVSFDNLNQIFYEQQKGGVIRLIFLIYERLEPILFEDGHYWMQRGKSIFHLKRRSIEDLLKAIEYTKKTYFDSPDFSRIKSTSSFQIAMIYNRIAALQNFSNSGILNESVDWLYISLKENEHNIRTIDNFLNEARADKRKSDFYNLCSYILTHGSIINKAKREFLLGKLFNREFSNLNP